MGGSALAEQMGRIIAALSTNTSSFFEMANANMAVFGDDYDKLIKAIQGGEVDQVFMLLAKNFNNLSKSTKTYIVDLLGGQRQANALLAAFGDPEGIKSAKEDAESAAGALDKRVERLQKRVSVIFARIRTEFNTMVKAIIDAGLGEAAIQLAEGVGGAVKLFSRIFELVAKIDEKMNGILGTFIKIAAQALIIGSLWKAYYAMKGAAEGLRTTGVTVGQRTFFPIGQTTMTGAATGYFGNIGNAYRSGRDGYMNRVNPPGTFNNVGGMGYAANRMEASIRGAGRGLLAAVGGPAGAGFLAFGAAISAYQVIQNRIEEDRTRLKELYAVSMESDKSAENLRREAERYRSRKSTWESIKDTISGNDSDDEVLDAAADMKEKANVLERLSQVSQAVNEEQRRKLNKIVVYQPTDEELHELMRLYNPEELEEYLSTNVQAMSEAILAAIRAGGGDKGVEKYISDHKNRPIYADNPAALAYDALEHDYKELFEVLDPEDIVGSLAAALKDGTLTGKNKSAGLDLAKYIEDNALTNTDLKELFRSVQKATTSYTDFMNANLETMMANLDAAKAWLDSGGISTSEYVDALQKVVDQIKGKGDLSAEDYSKIL
ncbi:MAG: hypothetical protein KDA17_01415, partial [Candidatus Saccharibacteria bacterium]|nr:hypothetical protein [Candidatus Saccharibacteria bacterium]